MAAVACVPTVPMELVLRKVPFPTLSRISTVGMRKARVFPVPVFALARQSEPLEICGSAPDCTNVKYSYPEVLRLRLKASYLA
eukprot:157652-Amphidinium_carterae.1